MKNNMMNAATSLIQNLPAMKKFKKNDVEDVVSIREGKFVVPSCNRWKHRGIQNKICSTRILTKRRHRLRRDICSQWELKHIHDELDEDLNLATRLNMKFYTLDGYIEY